MNGGDIWTIRDAGDRISNVADGFYNNDCGGDESKDLSSGDVADLRRRIMRELRNCGIENGVLGLAAMLGYKVSPQELQNREEE